MDTLLVVAIVVTGLAVVTQACVLVAMYLMSKRVAAKVDGLVRETTRIMAPMEQVTRNLKTASEDFVEVGKAAREQFHYVESMVGDTREALNQITGDVRNQVNMGAEEIRETVMSPFREVSAIAHGVSAGVRVLFRRREPARPKDDEDIVEPSEFEEAI